MKTTSRLLLSAICLLPALAQAHVVPGDPAGFHHYSTPASVVVIAIVAGILVGRFAKRLG